MTNTRSHNASVARRLVAKVKMLAQRAVGRGTGALIPFLVARVKETVSVPGDPNIRAIRGAPPRRITGHLLQNVFGQKWGENRIVIGSQARAKSTHRHPGGFNYPWFHEVKFPGNRWSGLHPFVKPTVKKHDKDIKRIMRRTVQVGYGFGVGRPR